MDAAAEWLSATIPSTHRVSFIHNDYKYDNLVLAPDDLTRIIAVLDWEMATVGDPLMDPWERPWATGQRRKTAQL